MGEKFSIQYVYTHRREVNSVTVVKCSNVSMELGGKQFVYNIKNALLV